ncbi:MAG: hypothetical protein K0Q53_98 [Massilibacillus sp.]|jgi:UDP-2,3-diacylglucosamine pyrophosphatase LpxH|nr:hypothetical protein [Massilibacillus sp.]
MDWKQLVLSKHEVIGNKWEKISSEIEKETGEIVKPSAIRGFIRNEKMKATKPVIESSDLLKLLDKPHAIDELVNKSGLSKRIILAQIEDYKDAGYNIEEIDGTYQLSKYIVPKDNEYSADWNGNKIIKFGVVSDTHLCSNDQQLTHLNSFYDLLVKEGISECYHAGDISEGVNMRQGHQYEVFKQGVDQQARYIIENYPERAEIKTYYITGNHDHSGIKSAGVDIGRMINNEREDLIYLGKQSARVMLTPNCSMDLVHPLDGASYAISYSTQKYIDSLSGGSKSSILIIGHHHKSFMLPVYRNIAAFEAGTFQKQTKWMQGKRLAANVGGWILEVEVDSEGTIKRCKGEFIPYYKFIENDY